MLDEARKLNCVWFRYGSSPELRVAKWGCWSSVHLTFGLGGLGFGFWLGVRAYLFFPGFVTCWLIYFAL